MQLAARVPNFDEPIDALEICHENIMKRMATLEALAANVREHGMAGLREGAGIWREVLAFIEHSVRNHTLDEEHDLFPMLRRHGVPDLEQLHLDHSWSQETEAFIETEFNHAMESGDAAPERLERLAERTLELVRFYRDHIARENGTVFPHARTVLSPEEMASLGAAMRSRRGVAVSQ
ncbi:MAG TPA: hemerythrin domain-containing protein [Candidatus Kapabacteria bacterium]|nr:hemerythrin domain-containing protein [Candidatus Kapabacteria bacterium]